MKSPQDRPIVMTFASNPMKGKDLRWVANLIFPPGSGSDDMLEMTFEDGAGNPIGKAVFEFAGMFLRVRDGRSEIRYSDFIKGKHSTGIWLKRPDMEPVPGALTFV